MDKLVAYSSSESECEDVMTKPAAVVKEKKLPMLLETKPVQIDENKDSQDRVRSFPHVEGNWATHVYINYHLSEPFLTELRSKIEELANMHLVESPHVSLSKTFILRFHWISNFLASIKEQFRRRSNQSFILEFSADDDDAIKFLANEEKTRFFCCISVNESCTNMLSAIIDKVDESLMEFDLPVYYENRLIHMSLLWKTTEFTNDEKAQLSSFFKTHAHELTEQLVEIISCKTGNKLIEIVL